MLEQALGRILKPGTLDAYREAARDHGRSLEAELLAVLEQHIPQRPKAKDTAVLLALSDAALARNSSRESLSPEELTALAESLWAGTPATAAAIDSTQLIREDRDAR